MISYAISQNPLENIEVLSKKASILLYRDKNNPNYADYAKKLIEKSKNYQFKKVLLHQDYNLANSLNADGVHLTSSQFNSIPKAKELKLFVIVSTHSLDEVKKAQELNADMVTLSPIFKTPNKGKPLGVEKLKEIVEKTDIPIIALGGILSKEQINLSIKAKAKGFASIRYFL